MYGRNLLLLILLFCQPVMAGNSADTLGSIKKTRTITIAHPVTAPPFSSMQEGEPAGYSIDLCREIVDNLAAQLGIDDIKIKWRSASTKQPWRI